MIFDTRWLTVLLIAVTFLHVQCRVIDDEDGDWFETAGRDEEPFGDEPFEEDRYRESELRNQPAERASSADVEERPYRECTSPADCYQDECCHIGMQRYSVPSCRKLGAEGDFCRVGQEPVNETYYYPNGESKKVTEGHVLFCPCSDGLTCLRALCRPYKELYLSPERSHVNAL